MGKRVLVALPSVIPRKEFLNYRNIVFVVGIISVLFSSGYVMDAFGNTVDFYKIAGNGGGSSDVGGWGDVAAFVNANHGITHSNSPYNDRVLTGGDIQKVFDSGYNVDGNSFTCDDDWNEFHFDTGKNKNLVDKNAGLWHDWNVAYGVSNPVNECSLKLSTDATFLQKIGLSAPPITAVGWTGIVADYAALWEERDPNRRIILAGYSFGGASATFIADDDDNRPVIFDLVWLADPVGPDDGRPNACGAGFSAHNACVAHETLMVNCPVQDNPNNDCPDVNWPNNPRLLNSNILHVIARWQQGNFPPFDIDFGGDGGTDLAFLPENFLTTSLDIREVSCNFIGEPGAFCHVALGDKKDGNDMRENDKGEMEIARGDADATIRSCTEIDSTNGCGTQWDEDNGWNEVIAKAKEMNNKPTLTSTAPIQISELDTMTMTATDVLTKWDMAPGRVNMNTFRYFDPQDGSTKGLAVSEDTKPHGQAGILTSEHLDGEKPSTIHEVPFQVFDNGWPCDNCTDDSPGGPDEDDNDVGKDDARGATTKWDTKIIQVTVTNAPPIPTIELLTDSKPSTTAAALEAETCLPDSEALIIDDPNIEMKISALDSIPDMDAGMKYTVSWGDGTVDSFEETAMNEDPIFQHTIRKVGDTTITVFILDKDGDVGQKSIIVSLPDTDCDGIQDLVDTLPDEFSDDAEDETNFDGETDGTIIDRGDQDLSIIEEDNPDGLFIGAFTTSDGAGTFGISQDEKVVIQVLAPDPGAPAEISVCGDSALLRIVSGDSAIVTCGSVTIKGISGTVEADFQVGCKTHTAFVNAGQILTFDPETLQYTNDGTTDISIRGGAPSILEAGETAKAGSSCGSTTHEPPTIGKNLAGTKQMVNNGFCIDADCFTVTKLFHEEFKLYEMMSGTHTLSTLVYCAQGVEHCNYSAIGIMPYDKDMNDAVWKIEMKGNHLGEWTPVIFDPEGFLGEVTVTTQIISDKFLSVSYTIEFKNKQTPPMKVGVQLRDDKNGVRNFYFNEGVKFNDSDAYPYVETAFETPIKVEKLCINPQSHDRDSCGFELVRDWTQKKAQDLLIDMQNGNYIYDKYIRDRYYD